MAMYTVDESVRPIPSRESCSSSKPSRHPNVSSLIEKTQGVLCMSQLGRKAFVLCYGKYLEILRDLLAAIEDFIVFLNYIQKCYWDLNQERR